MLIFFDDIIIYSKSWVEHLEHLKRVLKLIQDHTLFAKHFKCKFEVSEIEYLGHIISVEGFKIDLL